MNNIIARMSAKISSKVTDERGDVPGWVLITLMTAGLVVAIWAIAAPALGTVFDQAISRVVSF
ncbi:MAG: hypothetical protein RSB13_05800 [Aurantimicrobium sp.]|jgi:hypothetical protein|uniref:Uncharacterized protein n=1 Tax=Aurantimicrobium photophilum TaxID=1987356 RepID=A0A2Z3RX38_9MICO|nr:MULTISPECIES: hypothetical protein [Aurantimicrobium]AWR21101.1 hypothetical protein AURMO_00485 [Aurantimicrobium photophilum]MDF9809094.1 hypothetical protein [Aurantimicrobium minutum]MDH6536552.1 hypothetical protein [Aurantimicrobium minutum]